MPRPPRALARLLIPLLATLAFPCDASVPGAIHDLETSAVPALVTTSACTNGTGALSSLSFGWTSPDAFSAIAWRIPGCASCAGQNLQVTSVSFRVRWLGACTAHVRVSLVATEIADCGRPDTTLRYGTPVVQEIVGGSTGVVHTIALPADFCAPAGSFVRVEFLDLGGCYPAGSLSPPITVATPNCGPCQQFFSTVLTHPKLTEWCDPDTTGAVNPLWMQVTTDCCANVGVETAGTPAVRELVVLRNVAPRIHLALRLDPGAERPVDLTIFDLAGRRVRTLLREQSAGGAFDLDWDGRSDAGGRVRPGVYQLRLRDGARVESASVILVD